MVCNLRAVYTRQATSISNALYRSLGFERLRLRKRTGCIVVVTTGGRNRCANGPKDLSMQAPVPARLPIEPYMVCALQ